jgi:23S rRNA pseudouridine955/2504/2580 synthase/23S rRNA pseudouridine1911/1915/1917 synthase
LSKDVLEERPILSRLALHSARLKFTAVNGEQFDFEAPLQKDLRALLQQLEKNK